LKTKHKILLAKAAYRLVHAARAGVGLGDQCKVLRSGIVFELDLSQGIDFSVFLLGTFEPRTGALLQRLIRPGQVVIDAGANIGVHTLKMAQLVGPQGRAIACEPTDFAFRKLVRNVELNPALASRITLLQLFLGPGDRHHVPSSIYSRWPLSGGSDLHEKHLGAKEAASGARAASIDEIVADQGVAQVDLIKIDVDGFECEVLAGAQNVISANRPILVMELAPYVLSEHCCSLTAILDVLDDAKYELFDDTLGRKLPMNAEELEVLIGRDAGINAVARAIPTLAGVTHGGAS
jgi:FkbM family methyltransferase